MQTSFHLRFVHAVALLRDIPVSGRAVNCHIAISVLGALAISAVLGEAQAVPNATPSPARAQHLKTYHDGSIRDISAIGNRNVGCKRALGNWYTLESMKRMSDSALLLSLKRSYAEAGIYNKPKEVWL
jgi:hypothetical protein